MMPAFPEEAPTPTEFLSMTVTPAPRFARK
jgi:hypothetical protein